MTTLSTANPVGDSAETSAAWLTSQHTPKPVRVLYVDHTAKLGGGEIALLNLILHLDRDKAYPIALLCTDGPLADKLKKVCEVHVMPLSDRITTVKKDTLGFATLLKLRDLATVFAYLVRLVRFIRRSDVDVVHTNSLKADLIAGVAGRLAGRRVIWHVRDRIEDDYLPRPVVAAFRVLSRFIPHFVIANSRATLSTLRLGSETPSTSIPSGIEIGKKMAVVHDGLDASANARRSDRRVNTTVGLIGRLCEWKGQHIFLDAAAQVRKRHPGTRFKIIGAPLFGEHDYETRVRAQCVSLGLADIVEFTGFRSDVSDVLAGLDIVVHASTTGEPFGQVIIEGMAAAKPVIATNGGGVPEIVVHNETGLLIPMGDAAAMADAICALLDDPRRASQMGACGLQRVRNHFTIQNSARSVEAVYQRLMSPTAEIA